ncbi:MAG: Tol-Pal system beta propeller repeat protein TolB [Burkholderiaceae bacterium]
MGALGALGGAAALPAARAEFRVEITGIGATQLPITLLRFRDEDQGGANTVSTIVRADLERSGAFRFVDAPMAIDETGSPGFADLRGRGSDALVAGSLTRLADGRFDVRYKLWDVVKGTAQISDGRAVHPDDLRLQAHRIADAIYEKLTGEKGVFATRVAYVTKGGGRYTLRVADADGEGGQAPLTSPDPIISPSWSPDGKTLAYVSFQTGKAVIWTHEVAGGQRRMVANFRGTNSAPAWSPDGTQLAVTLSKDGGSQIFLINRDGNGVPRRVTQSSAIDTEPVFSPDGKQLYFVSDRGGSPQIYRQPIGGGGAERVTFQGSYNVSPAISPDGRTLAFVQRQGGGAFKVMTMDLGSGSVQAVSDTSDDESPSFSPNGRFIIYATRAQGREVLMTTTVDGKIKTKLLTSGLDIREPVWGPFGR